MVTNLNIYNFLPKRKKFKFVHTIVIDEISMVSSVMLHHIHLRLCAIKGNNDKFGGLNVITIGDFFQLRPVRGNYVFTDFDLWKSIFKPFFLTQNVRQTNNHTYSDLLSRARVGALTKHDIMVLNSRVIFLSPRITLLIFYICTQRKNK